MTVRSVDTHVRGVVALEVLGSFGPAEQLASSLAQLVEGFPGCGIVLDLLHVDLGRHQIGILVTATRQTLEKGGTIRLVVGDRAAIRLRTCQLDQNSIFGRSYSDFRSAVLSLAPQPQEQFDGPIYIGPGEDL